MIDLSAHINRLVTAGRITVGWNDLYRILRLVYDPRWKYSGFGQADSVCIRVRRGVAYALTLRNNHSDVGTVFEIFGREQYHVNGVGSREVRRIIDLGANIGASALYLGSRYPLADVVCLEPEPSNFALLQRNVRVLGRRCRCLPYAVSTYTGTARLLVTDWAGGHRVDDGTPLYHARKLVSTIEVSCIGMPALLEELRWNRVDIVKMDIEGHEWQLIKSASNWLPAVGCVVGEYHHGTPLEDLETVFRDLGFDFHVGERDRVFVATGGVIGASRS